jgi:chaperonin cofactor prefoldin
MPSNEYAKRGENYVCRLKTVELKAVEQEIKTRCGVLKGQEERVMARIEELNKTIEKEKDLSEVTEKLNAA